MEEQPTVLIVDDDESTRKMYAQLLHENNINVIEAKDGVEGLDIATGKEKIDLIFTGIIMPRMDGFQLVKALKEYTNTVDIPVIANSHLGREEDREKMEKLEVNDFIVRGVTTPAEVVKRILHAIAQGEYNISMNTIELDAERFIKDNELPVEMKCEDCGGNLALNLKYFKDKIFKTRVSCPNCKKRY